MTNVFHAEAVDQEVNVVNNQQDAPTRSDTQAEQEHKIIESDGSLSNSSPTSGTGGAIDLIPETDTNSNNLSENLNKSTEEFGKTKTSSLLKSPVKSPSDLKQAQKVSATVLTEASPENYQFTEPEQITKDSNYIHGKLSEGIANEILASQTETDESRKKEFSTTVSEEEVTNILPKTKPELDVKRINMFGATTPSRELATASKMPEKIQRPRKRASAVKAADSTSTSQLKLPFLGEKSLKAEIQKPSIASSTQPKPKRERSAKTTTKPQELALLNKKDTLTSQTVHVQQDANSVTPRQTKITFSEGAGTNITQNTALKASKNVNVVRREGEAQTEQKDRKLPEQQRTNELPKDVFHQITEISEEESDTQPKNTKDNDTTLVKPKRVRKIVETKGTKHNISISTTENKPLLGANSQVTSTESLKGLDTDPSAPSSLKTSPKPRKRTLSDQTNSSRNKTQSKKAISTETAEATGEQSALPIEGMLKLKRRKNVKKNESESSSAVSHRDENGVLHLNLTQHVQKERIERKESDTAGNMKANLTSDLAEHTKTSEVHQDKSVSGSNDSAPDESKSTLGVLIAKNDSPRSIAEKPKRVREKTSKKSEDATQVNQIRHDQALPTGTRPDAEQGLMNIETRENDSATELKYPENASTPENPISITKTVDYAAETPVRQTLSKKTKKQTSGQPPALNDGVPKKPRIKKSLKTSPSDDQAQLPINSSIVTDAKLSGNLSEDISREPSTKEQKKAKTTVPAHNKETHKKLKKTNLPFCLRTVSEGGKHSDSIADPILFPPTVEKKHVHQRMPFMDLYNSVKIVQRKMTDVLKNREPMQKTNPDPTDGDKSTLEYMQHLISVFEEPDDSLNFLSEKFRWIGKLFLMTADLPNKEVRWFHLTRYLPIVIPSHLWLEFYEECRRLAQVIRGKDECRDVNQPMTVEGEEEMPGLESAELTKKENAAE